MVNRPKIIIIGGIILLGIVLAVGWWGKSKIEPKNQLVETSSGVFLEMDGVENGIKRGEEKEVDLILKAGEKLISGINVVLEVDQRYLKIVRAEVDESSFASVMRSGVEGDGARLSISALNMKTTSELPSGEIRVGKVWLKGVAKGESYAVLLPETHAIRYNGVDGGDNQLSLSLTVGEVVVK